ncbi:glycosyltransferase family 4 protein [Priestia megaterium]|uniref:glycosyltransferase family 4 protein n=1 Tax=Priestia megaterium TaxID=1404 RepID=UPI00207AFEAF|nr:glycosyltransferase family 4 protein [Priestia megaterium]USL44414.1 glycosyltransferase family 4 protein [Priestia megaterium]
MIKVLVMNHFPTIYPPNTGGVLRYFHLYNQLSKFYDITLLSQKYTPEIEIINYSNTFREFRIPTDEIQHKIDEKLLNEGIEPRFSTHAALSCALMTNPPPLFLKYYNQFYKRSDILIHESPFLLKYDIFFGLDNKPRIYNSHNLESEFAKHVWIGRNSQEYIKHVTHLEETLVQEATLVFATSKEEKANFINTFNADPMKIKLAPNGILPEEWKPRVNKSAYDSKAKVFFIGSMHQPNIDIVNFIVSELADKCPDVDFIIAGQCSIECSNVFNQNVTLLGEIDKKQKLELFSEVDIAINPAFFGTGTKIKTLEFLSAGIPLISTEVGVKGMRLIKGTHYFHATRENFAQILNEVSRDTALLKMVAANGKKYVNHLYSWKATAKKIERQLSTLHNKVSSISSI